MTGAARGDCLNNVVACLYVCSTQACLHFCNFPAFTTTALVQAERAAMADRVQIAEHEMKRMAQVLALTLQSMQCRMNRARVRVVWVRHTFEHGAFRRCSTGCLFRRASVE